MGVCGEGGSVEGVMDYGIGKETIMKGEWIFMVVSRETVMKGEWIMGLGGRH